MFKFEEYKNKNKNWHEEDAKYKSKIISNILKKNKVKFHSCIDIGCGTGKIIEYLSTKYQKVKFTGYDIHHELVTFWNNNKIKNITFTNKNPVNDRARYNLLLCIDVFEHVKDYYNFIDEISLLSNLYVFNIPLDLCSIKAIGKGLKNARNSVGHIHYFNTYTALETLKDLNYEILDFKLNPGFIFSKNITIYQKLIFIPRIVLYYIYPRLSADLFGGFSLTVLAKKDV